MTNQSLNLDDQIKDFLNRLELPKDVKEKHLARLPNLSDEQKRKMIGLLQNAVDWKNQLELDKKLLDYEEKYPMLLDETKKEIINDAKKEILEEIRDGTQRGDEQKAEEIIRKLKAMKQDSNESSNGQGGEDQSSSDQK